MALRTIIIDDHEIVRKGLKQIILDEYPNAKIMEAGSSQEAMKLIWHEPFDLIICDISMPGRSGIDLLKQVRKERYVTPVLMLSMHPEDEYAVRAIKAGASGYLVKDVVSQELITAIKQVTNNRKYISPAVAELLARTVTEKSAQFPHELLSNREYEVLVLIGAGKTVAEISEILCLGISTISTYRLRILEKMKMRSNTNMIRYVVENGLV